VNYRSFDEREIDAPAQSLASHLESWRPAFLNRLAGVNR
jgi:hypothetical protein